MTRPSKQLRALQPPAGPGWAGRPAQTDRQTDSRCWGTDAGWQEGPAVRALCPPLLPPAPRCLPGAKGGAPVSKPPSACPSSPLGSLAAGTPGEETGPKGSGHRVSDGPESLVVGGGGGGWALQGEVHEGAHFTGRETEARGQSSLEWWQSPPPAAPGALRRWAQPICSLPGASPTVRRSAISGGSQGQEGQLEPQSLT